MLLCMVLLVGNEGWYRWSGGLSRETTVNRDGSKDHKCMCCACSLLDIKDVYGVEPLMCTRPMTLQEMVAITIHFTNLLSCTKI